jgi:hypothetical protein
MTLVEPAPPIACTLNAAELRTRRTRIADLNRTALASYRRDDLRLELFYAIEARPQVLEMVRAEQTCCAFLTFEIREEHGALRVIVEAPERARDAANSILEAFYSTGPSQGASGCDTASIPADRVVGASAALAATGALVCGVCCVLPFAIPAAVLAVSGGVLGWFAKATPWAVRIALLAVLGGWAWVTIQSVRTKRQPARSTLLTLGVATAVFAAAAVWWHFEREIIHLLR